MSGYRDLERLRGELATAQRLVSREADAVDALRASQGRIRAAAESDAEIPSALRDFILRETESVASPPTEQTPQRYPEERS